MRKFKVVSIVLVYFFALAFTACDNGVTIGHVDGTGAGGGGGAAGNPPAVHGTPILVINRPLYLATWDANSNLVLSRHMGTHTVSGSDGMGGSGSISGGYLNFTIGTPTGLSPIGEVSLFSHLERNYGGITFSRHGVQGRTLSLSTHGGGLSGPSYSSFIISGNSFREEYVSRTYIFVSDDVVVTSPRIIPEWTGVYEAFTLNLRAGWNSFHYRDVVLETPTTPWHSTITISTADPGRPLRWLLWH